MAKIKDEDYEAYSKCESSQKPQKNNSFLTNIITNAHSFPLVNYIICFLKAGHSAHRMAKFTHTGTISTNNIHIVYILDHLKSSRGHSLMLSSYNLWQTAYLLGLGEAANAFQVSRRLKATNRMISTRIHWLFSSHTALQHQEPPLCISVNIIRWLLRCSPCLFNLILSN